MDVNTDSPRFGGFCYDSASTSPTVAYRTKYYFALPESRKMDHRLVAICAKNKMASRSHIAAITAGWIICRVVAKSTEYGKPFFYCTVHWWMHYCTDCGFETNLPLHGLISTTISWHCTFKYYSMICLMWDSYSFTTIIRPNLCVGIS
jgi:hypothetical protein